MRSFWDQRAREDAFFFVDDREPYRAADPERFWTRGEEDLDRLLGQVGRTLAPGDVVLEIGCGVGRLTRVLAARTARVLALDVSAEMLARARALNPHLANVEWIASDGVSLRPVPDASADVCLSHVVFQHIPDPRITFGYLGEVARVLRPGGWAALQVSNDPGVHRRRGGIGRLRRAAAGLLGRAPRGQSQPEWLGSAVDLQELRAAAVAAGLTVLDIANPGTQFCVLHARR